MRNIIPAAVLLATTAGCSSLGLCDLNLYGGNFSALADCEDAEIRSGYLSLDDEHRLEEVNYVDGFSTWQGMRLKSAAGEAFEDGEGPDQQNGVRAQIVKAANSMHGASFTLNSGITFFDNDEGAQTVANSVDRVVFSAKGSDTVSTRIGYSCETVNPDLVTSLSTTVDVKEEITYQDSQAIAREVEYSLDGVWGEFPINSFYSNGPDGAKHESVLDLKNIEFEADSPFEGMKKLDPDLVNQWLNDFPSKEKATGVCEGVVSNLRAQVEELCANGGEIRCPEHKDAEEAAEEVDSESLN